MNELPSNGTRSTIAAMVLIAAAGLTFLVVAGREWTWRDHHHFQPGPWAEIIALGIAGVGVWVIAAILIHEIYELRGDRYRV
jgi:hypothetical protein